MKEKETSKLYHSITNVSNQFIEESQTKTKKSGWPKWGTMAACLVIAAAIGSLILRQATDPAPPDQDGEVIIETSSLNIYCLSERSAIESKSVEIPNTPKDIFNGWAELNHVSDVTFIDCVYDNHGSDSIKGASATHSAGDHYTLSLTVSGEFSKYASEENGVLLIETLRRTFYDYNSFDELNLIIERLADVANSAGVPGMQADDGKILVWEETGEKEIDGTECYAFELRFSEDESVNGEMAARLFGIYAVSKNGMEIYHYNQADDVWEPMKTTSP